MKPNFDTYILIRAIDIAMGQGGFVRPADVERSFSAGNESSWGISRYAVRKAFKSFMLDGIFLLRGNKYKYNPGNVIFATMSDAFREMSDQR